jgi:NAD(P)-dependent dehydrogenase (short-subunit alcohol dehydrogenase family)
MSEFQDKVVLVTGAGRGLGRLAVSEFSQRGAVVAANDINPLCLDELVAECTARGGRVRSYCFDVAKRMPVMALISQVVEELGRIDIVINNAAVEPVAGVLEMDEWDWHRTIDVNLAGAFFIMQQAGRLMHQQNGGVIVNIGANPGHTQSQRSAYLASKAGLLALTRQAALELAAESIRVHAVCPGKDALERLLYLCSQSAAHLTGQIINCGEDMRSR